VSLKTAGILLIPAVLTVVATQWSALQRLLGTQPLTGEEWLGAVALASVVFIVIEIEKIIRRNRSLQIITSENPIVVLHGDAVAAIDAPVRS
jgi:hypothetical protein